MKKFMFLLACLVCLSYSVFAADYPVTSAGNVPNAIPGTSAIPIPVTVTGFNNIGNFTLTLTFDTTRVRYTSAILNPLLSGMTVNYSTSLTNSQGKLIFTWTGAIGSNMSLPDGSSLADLTFSYVTGTGIIRWAYSFGTVCQYKRYVGNTLTLLTQTTPYLFYKNGGISYRGAPDTYAPILNVSALGPVAVPLTTTDFTGISAMTLSLEYDPAIMTYVNFVKNPAFVGNFQVGNNTGTGGKKIIRIQWYGTAVTLINGATICTLNFSYIAASSNGTTLNWIDEGGSCEYTEGSGDVLIDLPQNDYFHNGSVTPAPVSVSVAPSANPSCGENTVTFTATATNGGSTPVFLWKVNGAAAGTNSSTFVYTPANNDAVTCDLTSSLPITSGNPATSNQVIMTVLNSVSVDVSVSPSASSVCAGTSVLFNATPVNGGSTPVYQWMVNGLPVGTNSALFTYEPANNDVVTCQLTSSEPCTLLNPVTSNTVTMTVFQALPASIVITPSANPVCEGTSDVTFTALPVNGGDTPTFQWMLNGSPAGTNNSIYSFTAASNDVVTCQLTSSDSCAAGNPAMSNSVTMSVLPILPVGITVNASVNPVCEGISVTYTASADNGGSTPMYQWMVNGSPAGTNSSTFSYSPANNDMVNCQLTSSDPCTSGNPAMSNTITMTVLPVLPVAVTVAPSVNPACSGIPVIFTATPVNEGPAPVYQWMVNNIPVGSNSTTYSYSPVNNDVVKCVLTSDAPCISGNPATSNEVVMSVGTLVSADFIADNLTPLKTDVVTLSDLSTGEGLSWNWSFDKPGVSFVNGTTNLSQNPQVIFTDGGPFTVTLITSNNCYTDTETKEGYIVVGTPGLWLGSTSNDWNTPTNWDNSLVPDSSTNVVIPATAANWPVFDGDFVLGIHCSSLHLNGITSELTITGTMTIP